MKIKETQIQECRVYPDFRIFLRIFLIAFAIIGSLPTALSAQELFFQSGEELQYDIRYKYGLVVMKGGTAKYTLNTTTYNQKQAAKSSLDFKTSSFFDKIYKIRDTLYSYAEIPNLRPLYHKRIVNEGGTHYSEELVMKKHGNSHSEVNVKRIRREEVRIDTTMTINSLVYDMLNIFLFVRNLDYSTIALDDSYNMATFFGKDRVNITIRYAGESTIKKSDKLKYNALRFTVDITDDAFTEAKSAMEVWISNDKNRLPLKLKAKLKIGAAEADLSSYKNLKYPFSSKIESGSGKN